MGGAGAGGPGQFFEKGGFAEAEEGERARAPTLTHPTRVSEGGRFTSAVAEMRAGRAAVAVGWPRRRRKGEEGAHVTFSDSHRSNCGGIIAVSLARSDGQADGRGRARVRARSKSRHRVVLVGRSSESISPSSPPLPRRPLLFRLRSLFPAWRRVEYSRNRKEKRELGRATGRPAAAEANGAGALRQQIDAFSCLN